MADRPPREVTVHYGFVHGAHCFTSREVPGLRAIGKDLALAHRAVAIQLGNLIKRTDGTPVEYLPSQPWEKFLEYRDWILSAPEGVSGVRVGLPWRLRGE